MKRFLFLVVFLATFSLILSVTGCSSSDTETEKTTVVEPEPVVSQAPDLVDSINVTGADASNITDPVIRIDYLPAFYFHTDYGNVLVINIAVENRGYDSFDTNPEYFSVVVNNTEYKYEPELSALKTYAIPNGGKILGKLSFPVPSGISETTIGYSLKYTGKTVYRILWVKRD